MVSLHSFRLVLECSKSANRTDLEFELHIASYKLTVKTKFHYAILVADRSNAGRRPASSWNLPITSSDLARASRSVTGLRSAWDLSATRIA